MSQFPFDEEKAVSTVLYIIQQLGGSVSKHTLAKILYFADQKHMVRYGRPVIGDKYIAMQYGPVPSDVLNGINATNSDTETHYPIFQSSMNLKGIFVCSENLPDMDEFSKSDLNCLNESIEENKGLNFQQLVDKSHGEAWHSAGVNRPISMGIMAKEAGASSDMIKYIKGNAYELQESL